MWCHGDGGEYGKEGKRERGREEEVLDLYGLHGRTGQASAISSYAPLRQCFVEKVSQDGQAEVRRCVIIIKHP